MSDFHELQAIITKLKEKQILYQLLWDSWRGL